MKKVALTAAQLRGARALLRWSAEDLANASMLGVATIRRAEIVEGPLKMTTSNMAAAKRALENAGIEFIDENGGGCGVRFKKRRSRRQR